MKEGKAKGIRINVRTGKIEQVEEPDMERFVSENIETVNVDLTDLKRLIEYAKQQRWI